MEEFYQIAFRKKIYNSIEELQEDLDEWLLYYNIERTHQGKFCFGRPPKECFLEDKKLAQMKMIGYIKEEVKD